MNELVYRFHYLLAGAWRRRYAIVTPILLMPLLGLAVATVTPKQYAAHTSMLIQETAKMNPFLEDLAVSANLAERMAALKTLLHSRHILGAVAEARGLVTEDTDDGQRDEVIADLSERLSVKLQGKDLIRIDYKSRDPEGMREMLETVTEKFVDQILAPERSSMKDSAYFLAQHLKARREDLDKAEAALAEFKDENAAALPELHAGNVNRLGQLRQMLAEREAELAGAQHALGSINDQLSRTNPVVGRLEEQIVATRGELALLRSRYTDDHSTVQAALRQLRRLEEERQAVLAAPTESVNVDQLFDRAANAVSNLDEGVQPLLVSQLENFQQARSRVDALAQESDRLKSMITDLEEKTAGYGQQERELLRMQRDLDVKRKLYEELLHRYEMARVTGSLGNFEQGERIKIIDQPYTPTRPSNLPPLIFAVAGVFGGLMLGCGLGLVLEVTDNTLRRKDIVQSISGLQVISRLPSTDRIQGATA